jgi:hypothetical protein
MTELRVGHQEPDHRFHNPDIPIAHGTEVISRTLVNDRAICPNAAFAAHAAQPYSGDPQYEGCRCYRRRGIQPLDIVITAQR